MDNGDIKNLSLFALFRLEVEQQTSILNKKLLELERNPDSYSILETLMRSAHSLKGAARIVELETVVNLAHAMEDCFVAAQRRSLHVNSDHMDALLNSVDVIGQLAFLPEADLTLWLSQQQTAIIALQTQLESMCHQSGATELDTTSGEKRGISTNHVTAGTPTSKQQHNTVFDTVVSADSSEPVLRINANRLTRLLGLSSELMMEAQWLRPYADSMLQLRKRFAEISALLEKLREGANIVPMGQRHSTLLGEAQRKLAYCRSMLTERILALDDYDRRNSNLSTQLYNEVLASRMRPFSDCTQGLLRMARDAARRLGKDVRVMFDGLDTPVDRDVLERLKAPLSHLLINAIDHGIEPPQQRQTLGKQSQGIINIQAQQSAGMLMITLADDGEGINLDILKSKILHKKLASADLLENLSEAELLEFLFLPDFTTRSEVTEYSGRGVGLDVVKNLMNEIQGSIKVSSIPAQGSKFILQLPLSLSVVSGLIVIIDEEPYAFPLSRVEKLASVSVSQVHMIDGRIYAEINGEFITLVSARRLFNPGIMGHRSQDFYQVVILMNDQKRMFGIIVDDFIGQKDLAVQALDSRLGKVQDIGAAALMEDGRPVLIIDVDDMLRSIEVVSNEVDGSSSVSFKQKPQTQEPKTILVIDDSVTIREMEKQLLQSKGYRVDLAVDGIDGWNALRRKKYHLVVTDVDMPRMDGIELVQLVKNDTQLKTLPIMILSYKDRPEDRQRGLNAGADYYLTKGDFQDESLIEAVADLIGEVVQ